MIDRERLRRHGFKYGIDIKEILLEQLDIYARMMLEWNKRINLTAITDPNEIEVKHFLDSLLVAQQITEGESVADIGTGAGFPGLVIKLARPRCTVTLMDSVGKRFDFLEALCKELGVEAEFVVMRAEEAGKKCRFRERFDIVTARAVAQLDQLAEYCLPITRVGGRFIAMKGRLAKEELNQASGAIGILGGGEAVKKDVVLPDGSERSLLITEKLFATPQSYPRSGAAIKKRPL